MSTVLRGLAAEIANAPEAPAPRHEGVDTGVDSGIPHDGAPPHDSTPDGPDGSADHGPDDRGHDGGGFEDRPRGAIFEGCPVVPLGVDGNVSFYLDTLGQLRSIDNHSLDKIRHVFGGNVQVLARHFPQFDSNGNPKAGKFDQAAAAALMTQAAAECGVWRPTNKVRGAGCWTDVDGGLIIHAGDQVMIGGKWVPPGLYQGKVYSAADAVPRPAPREARYDAPARLLELIETWAWRRPDIDPVLALGLIMSQMLGGALEWRPVAWLSGSKATGKSTFQKLLHHVHGGEAGLLQAADATEAGIRSVIGHSSLPVAIDELEPDVDRPQKVKGVVELARRAASGAQIFRGSSDQKGYQSNAWSCFLFSSILVPDMPAQDRSRLILLELDALPPGTPKLDLDPRQLRTIGEVLRKRILEGWDDWRTRLDLWRAALAEQGQEGRAGDNYATVLALADMALHRDLPDADALANWAVKIGKAITDDAMEIGDDSEDMVLHMMGQLYDPFRRGQQYTIAQWVMAAAELKGAPEELFSSTNGTADRAEKARVANRQLAQLGLRVNGIEGNAKLFFPCKKIPQLCAIFEGSPWANGVWYQSAQRMKDVERPPGAIRLAGIQSRGVYVPLTSIPGLSDFQTSSGYIGATSVSRFEPAGMAQGFDEEF